MTKTKKKQDNLIFELLSLTNNIQLLRTSVDELVKELRSIMVELNTSPGTSSTPVRKKTTR